MASAIRLLSFCSCSFAYAGEQDRHGARRGPQARSRDESLPLHGSVDSPLGRFVGAPGVYPVGDGHRSIPGQPGPLASFEALTTCRQLFGCKEPRERCVEVLRLACASRDRGGLLGCSPGCPASPGGPTRRARWTLLQAPCQLLGPCLGPTFEQQHTGALPGCQQGRTRGVTRWGRLLRGGDTLGCRAARRAWVRLGWCPCI